MGLRLIFLPNFPEATFIQGATFILDSRVSSPFACRMNGASKTRYYSLIVLFILFPQFFDNFFDKFFDNFGFSEIYS